MTTISMSDLGLSERPKSINQWIDEQIAAEQFKGLSGHYFISADRAADIARGVALHIIADKATLITNLANEIHARNVAAGWWTDLKTGEDLHGKRNIGELLCLVHSEVSEAEEGSETMFKLLTEIRDGVEQIWNYESARRDALLKIHARVSRAMEGHRKALMDSKLPERPTFRVELIDAMIRILDILGSDNKEHPAGDVFVEKLNFNSVRPDHKPENRVKEGGKAY